MENCQFLNPLTFENLEPTSTDFWQYSEMVCSSTQSEMIENASTGASFYLVKEFDYGDLMVITFLLVFLIFGILKFFLEFINKKFYDN